MKKANSSANFFEDKGFYIILFLCILAIGISGYVLFFTPGGNAAPNENDFNYPVLNSPTSTIDTSSDIPVVKDDDVATPTIKEENPPVEDKTKDDKAQTSNTEVKKDTKDEKPLFVLPIKKGIIKPFSSDQLVYDRTMSDWRVHTGTDFEGNAGDRVYAISAGVIEDIYDDDMFGKCVILDLGNDLKCIYSGLRENVTAKKGATVKAGDVIGVIGETNIAESNDPSHLHLEVQKDGKNINPEEILPQSQN